MVKLSRLEEITDLRTVWPFKAYLECAKVKDEEIKAVLEGLALAIRSYPRGRRIRCCWI